MFKPPKNGAACKRLLRFWGTVFGLIFLGFWLSDTWVFEYAGLLSSDRLARLRAPETAMETGIVFITAEEHKRVLAGVSPIPPINLQQAVCAVLREKPRVLGVELDTAHTTIVPPRTNTRIVWARGIWISRRVTATGEDQLTCDLDYVLGRAIPDVLTGIAVAPVTPDWSVREIPACYQYEPGRAIPTLTAALSAAAGTPLGEYVGGN